MTYHDKAYYVVTQVKQNSVVLLERLQELEQKKEQLEQEKRQRGTPKEEKERLLVQVNGWLRRLGC